MQCDKKYDIDFSDLTSFPNPYADDSSYADDCFLLVKEYLLSWVKDSSSNIERKFTQPQDNQCCYSIRDLFITTLLTMDPQRTSSVLSKLAM